MKENKKNDFYMMKFIDNYIYIKVSKMKTSYNCEYAGILYCEAISRICVLRPNSSHSILRIAIRPIFYLGYSDSENIILWLEYQLDNTRKIKKFLNWLRKKENLLKICLEELHLCCYFYGLKYVESENLVILKTDYGEVFKFLSFLDFKVFFYKKIEYLNISDEEIDRIIEEEEYFKEFDKIKY